MAVSERRRRIYATMMIGLACESWQPGSGDATYRRDRISRAAMLMAPGNTTIAIPQSSHRTHRLRFQIAYIRSIKITSDKMIPITINHVTAVNRFRQASGVLNECFSVRDRVVSMKGK
ncbi:hypothetical protein BD779DRAFT_1543635 [Infundibulicybe gibba]|nr:hypothetical protein BD779DRAFT_1543635 [Infundibulicybe gibba]